MEVRDTLLVSKCIDIDLNYDNFWSDLVYQYQESLFIRWERKYRPKLGGELLSERARKCWMWNSEGIEDQRDLTYSNFRSSHEAHARETTSEGTSSLAPSSDRVTGSRRKKRGWLDLRMDGRKKRLIHIFSAAHTTHQWWWLRSWPPLSRSRWCPCSCRSQCRPSRRSWSWESSCSSDNGSRWCRQSGNRPVETKEGQILTGKSVKKIWPFYRLRIPIEPFIEVLWKSVQR